MPDCLWGTSPSQQPRRISAIFSMPMAVRSAMPSSSRTVRQADREGLGLSPSKRGRRLNAQRSWSTVSSLVVASCASMRRRRGHLAFPGRLGSTRTTAAIVAPGRSAAAPRAGAGAAVTTSGQTAGEGQSTALGLRCRFCGRPIESDHNLARYNLEEHEAACLTQQRSVYDRVRARSPRGRRRRPSADDGQLDLFWEAEIDGEVEL